MLGLDGIYKWTKYRLPVYQVTYVDSLNEGRPMAYCITSTDTTENLSMFLKLLDDYAMNLGFSFAKPFVAIDHDDKERAALLKVNWKPCLCDFHLIKAINKKMVALRFKQEEQDVLWRSIKTLQRCQTQDELAAELISLRAVVKKISSEFLDYLESEWLCPEWLPYWIDVEHPKRLGLGNTNNYSESLFRAANILFFKGRTVGLFDLLRIITKLIFTYHAVRIQQNQLGLIKKKKNRTERSLLEREDLGWNLFKKSCVTVPEIDSDLTDCLYRCCSETIKDKFYLVNHEAATCTCAFYLWSGSYCKHFFAVHHYVQHQKFMQEKLPVSEELVEEFVQLEDDSEEEQKEAIPVKRRRFQTAEVIHQIRNSSPHAELNKRKKPGPKKKQRKPNLHQAESSVAVSSESNVGFSFAAVIPDRRVSTGSSRDNLAVTDKTGSQLSITANSDTDDPLWWRAFKSSYGNELWSYRHCTRPWEDFLNPQDSPHEHGWFLSKEEAEEWMKAQQESKEGSKLKKPSQASVFKAIVAGTASLTPKRNRQKHC